LSRPNRSFNADANTGHAFGILLASVGALRPNGLRRRLTRALGLSFWALCLLVFWHLNGGFLVGV